MADKASQGSAGAAHDGGDRNLRQALGLIQQALSGLQFGQVTLVVQDGRVIQIERLERKRLEKGAHSR